MTSHNRTDIVSQFYKVEYDTEEGSRASPPDTWITQFENFTVRFLEIMFNNITDHSFSVPDEVVDMNEILNELTDVMHRLDPDLFAKSLPMMADLRFLKKQAIKKVPNDDAIKIITDYKDSKETPEHIEKGFDYRLTALVSFVENIRRYAEVMLNTAGCTQFGHSSRRIARNLRRTERERKRRSLGKSKEKVIEINKGSKSKKKQDKPAGDGTTNKTGGTGAIPTKSTDWRAIKHGDLGKASIKPGEMAISSNKQGEIPHKIGEVGSTTNKQGTTDRHSRQQSLFPNPGVPNQKPRRSTSSEHHSGIGGTRKKSTDKDSNPGDRGGSPNQPEGNTRKNSDSPAGNHNQAHKGSLGSNKSIKN